MKSLRCLFEEMERNVKAAEAEISRDTASAAAFQNWCADPGAVGAFGEHREAFAAVLLEMLRKHLWSQNLALMAGFDGATALADDGVRLKIVDQARNTFPDGLHGELMDYLMDRGLW